jgi:hypothetical protein
MLNHRPCIGKLETSHQRVLTGSCLACEAQEDATNPPTGSSVTVLRVQFHTVLTSLMRAKLPVINRLNPNFFHNTLRRAFKVTVSESKTSLPIVRVTLARIKQAVHLTERGREPK